MAVVELTRHREEGGPKTKEYFDLRPVSAITGASTGDWVRIPVNQNGERVVNVTLAGDSTWSAKIEVTNYPIDLLEAGTGTPDVQDWDAGTVSAITSRGVAYFSAIRHVGVAGTSRMTVNA